MLSIEKIKRYTKVAQMFIGVSGQVIFLLEALPMLSHCVLHFIRLYSAAEKQDMGSLLGFEEPTSSMCPHTTVHMVFKQLAPRNDVTYLM